nr:PLDc N-terminal domain-containing protein [Bacteroides intestinalis]
MDIVLVGIISVILLDIAVLREIVRSKTQEYKVLYTLIILFLPIIGVSIYYLIRK